MKGSIPGIDLARIAAAFMVMLYHFFYWNMQNPEYYARFSGAAAPGIREFMHFGWIGVEIFFVISGIVIHRSAARSSSTRFLSNRILRLAPAVWICAPISILCGILLGNISPDDFVWPLLNGLFFEPLGPWPDGVYWTLGIECAFYMLTFMCLALGRFNLLMPLVLILSAVSTTCWVMYFFFHASWPILEALPDNRLFQLALLRHAPFFAMGILMSELRSNRKLSTLLWLGALYSTVGCLGEIWVANHGIDLLARDDVSAQVPILVWTAFIVLLGLSTLYQKETGQGQIERRLGLATYPLYLVHGQLGVLVATAARDAGLAAILSIGLGVLVSFALSLVIALWAEPWVAQRMRRTIDLCASMFAARTG